MSEDYVTEAMDLLRGEPAAIIEQPRARKVLRDGIGEEWTVAWVKLSTAFKPHIKEIRGAPLAVWLYIALSVNKQGISFPSINKIAEDTGYSRNGVMDAVAVLEEKGYMKVRRGERRYNLYEPEFAAIGKTNEPSDESTQFTNRQNESTLQTNESTFSANESSTVDSNKSNKINESIEKIEKSANKTVDFILRSTLSPKAIQDAVKLHFKLTPNWEAKYNRQWMEWAVQNEVTPEQVECAANVWKMDKRFNWKMYDLKGIQEHWLELIESFTGSAEPRQPDTDGGYN